MMILHFDVETAPNIATVWSLWKQNIGTNQLIDTSRVMCFAASWEGEREIDIYDENTMSHEDMIKKAWEYLDEADAVVTYNGNSFDIPTLNKEFIKYRFAPPSPYKPIDLYRVAKKKFRFPSHSMDHLAHQLGCGRKLRHEGHELWLKCMEGDKSAWDRMRRYNKRDVLVMKRVYHRMLPWIDNHPNVTIHDTDGDPARPSCTNCGGMYVIAKGFAYTKSSKYRRYKCKKCGTNLRSRYKENKGRQENLLTQER